MFLYMIYLVIITYMVSCYVKYNIKLNKFIDCVFKQMSLPNRLIQIVSSKTFFTIAVPENKVIVIQNNQNNGDLIASKSSISSLVFVSGIINIINTNIDVINTLKTNTVRRQLNLSVIMPKVNLAINPGIGITAKMKPTMNDEYPRCLAIVDRNGISGA